MLDPFTLLTERDGELPAWLARAEHDEYVSHEGRTGWRVRAYGLLYADEALGDLGWLYVEHGFRGRLRARVQRRQGSDPVAYCDIRILAPTTTTTERD